MYSLNPVKAYDLGLVKQIEVDSVMGENAMNEAFIKVENIQHSGKNKIIAKILLDVNTPKGVQCKEIKIDRNNCDLFKLSGEREIYRDLYVEGIDIQYQKISLSNGQTLMAGETQGGHRDEVQRFMDNAVKVIKDSLYALMIDGIKYEKIGSKIYEMTLFDDANLEIYLDNFAYEVKNTDKTIYENYIPLDSSVENQFAKDCETSENIEFYFKLPSWFKISTPIGKYNPDWAVIFKGEKKVYFVAETKGEEQELRGSEKLRVKCGESHFENLGGVAYRQVSKVGDLL
jgi:restriction endonuclease